MGFNFKRSWNFENTRQLDSRDLREAIDPDSDMGQALQAFFDQLSIEASLPPGGSTGMVLTKLSNADGDVNWVAITFPIGVPTGGTTGQVLRKTGAGDNALGWIDLPAPNNTAVGISYGGSANLSSTNVEAALDELDAEKAALVHTHAQADVTGLTTALGQRVPTTTVTALNQGTVLPAAGQAGRLFVLHT